jgi:hypothetical protein
MLVNKKKIITIIYLCMIAILTARLDFYLHKNLSISEMNSILLSILIIPVILNITILLVYQFLKKFL